MHKIRALCLLIRTETLKKATAGRGEYDRLPKMMPQLIEKLRYLSGYSIRFIRLSGFYTKIMHSEYNKSVGWISEAHPPLSCILQKSFQIHAGNPRWLRGAPIRRVPSALNRPCNGIGGCASLIHPTSISGACWQPCFHPWLIFFMPKSCIPNTTNP